MKSRGIFEFEDQSWLPGFIRGYMMDYLRFLFQIFKLYDPVLTVLKDALAKSNSNTILDLCSGSGGTIELIYKNLKQTFNPEIKVILSDLFPSESAFELLSKRTNGGISFVRTPIDASAVPSGLEGFRTIFSAFHHFEKEKAKLIVRDAVESREGIAIFDGGNRSVWMILLIIIAHPVFLFLCTPFFKPFQIKRLVFTYLIPVIPFCTIWDGIISIFRLYKSDEMLQIARETDEDHYIWKSGKFTNRFGLSIAYLTGYPKKTKVEIPSNTEFPL
ncbi:MAG TPA: class I SAM-dependent methyltransferase [Lentimicrobium sp.]|nr:class I SAM-dependent methyltransferase [Lentimicrobium sp.]